MALHVHRTGSGPPLVLVHGVGHHWQTWRPVIDLLDGELDLVAADLPGCGRSPALADAAPSVHSFADAFERLFGELGLDRPHIAGNSMGGGVALELARRRAVRSVTAFSPIGFWTAAERRWCQEVLRTLVRIPPPVRPAVRAALRTSPGRVLLTTSLVRWPSRLSPAEAVATFDDAWASASIRGSLDSFGDYRFGRGDELRGVPVTIAWGDHDRLLPWRLQAPRARAALPWARHVTLGAGHVPFSDDPAACAEVLRARVRGR